MEQVARQPRADKSAADPAFDVFWDAYPRKAAKPAARKAWKAAIKRATVAEIMAGLARYRPDPQFTAYPGTWLNQDRWADEPATLTAVPGNGRLTAAELENLLGPDVWSPPDPPGELTPDEAWAWQRDRRLEHIEDRQQQARQRLGRTA